MKAIYKYKLNPKDNILELPAASKILSVTTQKSDIVVYAVVDNEETEKVKYDFRVFGTGCGIDINIYEYEFLGTVTMMEDTFVFHVFYKRI
jgi:hypothetical protein